MNSNISIFFSFLLLVFPLTSALPPSAAHPPTNSNSDASLVTEACNFCLHKHLCLHILHADAESSHADLRGLAMIALIAVSSNATAVSAHINSKLETEQQPAAEQSLDDCLEHYLDASDQLEDAVVSLTARNFKDVKTRVDAAVADSDSCDVEFKDQGVGTEHVLAHTNRVFRQLCNVVLSIIDHLE